MIWVDRCSWCGLELIGWNRDHDVAFCAEAAALFDGVRMPTVRLEISPPYPAKPEAAQ
jgi:hypothetical protein